MTLVVGETLGGELVKQTVEDEINGGIGADAREGEGCHQPHFRVA